MNRWGLELATYNITFEWISRDKNKAADCLTCLVELPPTTSSLINMLSVSNTDGPSFNTRSQTQQHLTPDTSTVQPSITPEVSPVSNPTPKSLTADRLEALLQMQKTNPFCKWISKCLSNGKALQHKTDLFYPYQRPAIQTCHRFRTEVSCSSHTQVLEVHSSSGSPWQVRTPGKHPHLLLNKESILLQGNEWGYEEIHCQLYNMPQRKSQNSENYPLQMREIPNRPFDKIVIDLFTECETSTSGNKHILMIIDHLTGWPEAFPILDKSADTIVSTFINEYLPVHMFPRYILSDDGTEFKKNLMDEVLKQLGIDRIFSAPHHPQSKGKLEVFHKYLKPTMKKLCEKTCPTGINILTKFLPATESHLT